MADRTVFVDGTTSGTPGTTGAHYASLQAMVTGETGAAPDLVTGTAILHVECSVFSGDAADTTPCVINGFTTDATHYVNIYAAAASRAGTSWSDTKYRLYVANATALEIRDEFVRIDGLQIGKSSVSGNDQVAIHLSSTTNGVFWLSNIITRHAAGSRQMGIYIACITPTVHIWNWINYGHPVVESNYNSGLAVADGTGGTVNVYSSTILGGHRGVWEFTVGSTLTAKNVYASTNDPGTGAGYFVTSGTLNQTNCAASDATADGTAPVDNVAINTTNFTNVTPGSEDFAIPTGSALKDVGTNTSGESAPLNFTTDINGETRSGTWDIGADEFVVGGAPGPGNLAVLLGEPTIGSASF